MPLKPLLLFALTLICCFNIFGQSKVYTPLLLTYPELQPDTIQKYLELSKQYYALLETDIIYDSLTNEQKAILEQEDVLSEGPFFTGSLGCSWYCAAYPKLIRSTSELDSVNNINYSAKNVHDFDAQTAWIEGVEGYGVGEELTIEFELSPNLSVSHIQIFNGYSKSLQKWKEHARVKVFSVYQNNQYLGDFQLEDTYYGQEFEVGELKPSNTGVLLFTFIIQEVYAGEKYSETAISEINFDGKGDH